MTTHIYQRQKSRNLRTHTPKPLIVRKFLQGLKNIRALFTKSSKEKSTSSNHLTYPKVGSFSEALTSGQPIQHAVSGLLSIMTKTGMWSMSITRLEKQSTIMQVKLMPVYGTKIS